MAIQTFFMANSDYAAAAGASCAVVGELLDVGPSFKEGHNVLDFGLQERVNWREEAIGVGARKRSTAAIHAAEGALAPAQGQALATARRRHSCARAAAHAHTSVHVQAGARARESRRGPRGSPWDQARRQCAAPSPSMPRGWALAQSGQREPERERGVTPNMRYYPKETRRSHQG